MQDRHEEGGGADSRGQELEEDLTLGMGVERGQEGDRATQNAVRFLGFVCFCLKFGRKRNYYRDMNMRRSYVGRGLLCSLFLVPGQPIQLLLPSTNDATFAIDAC
jgi:hypothetical protein